MRLFFFMLLLLNGAFFAVNTLREPTETPTSINIDNSFPPLVLLSEQKLESPIHSSSIKTDSEVTTEVEPTIDLKTWLAQFTAETEPNLPEVDPVAPEQKETKTTLQCYTAGPFHNSDSLQQAASFFNNFNISFQKRSIIEKQYIGMLVYLPSYPNRKAIVNVAEALAAKGVKDYILLNEPGKSHALSLGVFSLKKNAEQRIKILSKLNYNAKSEARYRSKTIYWLDYSIDKQKNQIDLTEEHMISLNASQIQRNCIS